jgi:hypothetical protein
MAVITDNSAGRHALAGGDEYSACVVAPHHMEVRGPSVIAGRSRNDARRGKVIKAGSFFRHDRVMFRSPTLARSFVSSSKP